MSTSDYLKSLAEVFADNSEGNRYYVQLPVTRLIQSKLVNSLNNPFKIILIYGPPGTGKSYTFNRFHEEFREKHNIYLFKTPDFNMNALKEIYKNLTGVVIESEENSKILESFRGLSKEVIILLDEAQLYSPEEMERIRLISNEDNIKFIISVHRVSNEDVLAQEHFQTRVYENISFNKLSVDDIKQFVEEKFLLSNASNYLERLNKKTFVLVDKFSGGNLREINRLLNRTFYLLQLKVEQNPAFRIDTKAINKFIEMAAIDLGVIHKKRKRSFFKWI